LTLKTVPNDVDQRPKFKHFINEATEWIADHLTMNEHHMSLALIESGHHKKAELSMISAPPL